MLNITKPFFMWSHFNLVFQEQLYKKYIYTSTQLQYSFNSSLRRENKTSHFTPKKLLSLLWFCFVLVFGCGLFFVLPSSLFFFLNMYCKVGKYLWECRKERVWIWKKVAETLSLEQIICPANFSEDWSTKACLETSWPGSTLEY